MVNYLQSFDKDPDAVLDYVMDWEAWLGTDTISASEWSASSAGITVDDDTEFTDTTATVILSGGTAGSVYYLTNHITTAAGREDDRTIRIRVKQR